MKMQSETEMLQCFEHASDLPPAWDACLKDWRQALPGGGSLYLEKEFLEFLEAVNPCGQRYWFSEADGVLWVTYRLKLNLLNFLKWGRVAVPATMVGVPLSVAAPGYAVREPQGRARIENWIRSTLKGLTVILNVPEGEAFNLPKGLTLSSYVLDLGFEDFESYTAALRSPYRRQLRRALGAFQDVTRMELLKARGSGTDPHENLGTVPRQNFGTDLIYVNRESQFPQGSWAQALHGLYLQVFEHSRDQLERLGPDYIKDFPGRTFLYASGERLLAFVQTLDEVTEMGVVRHFVLGGFDRNQVAAFDLYRNLLLDLIRQALQDRCAALHLGQTAEESKSKTGAREQLKSLYVAHSNPLLHKLLGTLVKRFSYQRYQTTHHVFK